MILNLFIVLADWSPLFTLPLFLGIYGLVAWTLLVSRRSLSLHTNGLGMGLWLYIRFRNWVVVW